MVIELAQINASTLGFLPRGAFLSHAANGQIFVALDESGELAGYLLYGINHREWLAYITHLCVDQARRKKGTARALFNKLKEATKHQVRGIRVRCRRDYEESGFWPKLGFQPLNEIPGRSKYGTTLTVWWFDYGHPTLFTYADQAQTKTKLRVVIDANVFYELGELPTSAKQRSQVLTADWLDVELCLTNEIFTEINRKDDGLARQRARSIVHSGRFPMLSNSDEAVQRICERIRDLFPQQMSESTESDLRHIAKTVANGEIQFFVTHDDLLLNKADQIYDRLGLRIIRPSDLVIHQDALIREMEYQPSRLAGSSIKIQRIHSQQGQLLEDHFRGESETKKGFRQRLQPYLTDPHTFETNTILREEQLLALVVYSRQDNDTLEIPLLRIVPDFLSPTLARHLILRAVLVSTREKRRLTQITDTFVSDSTIDALQEVGFVLTEQAWIKANLRIVEEAEKLRDTLISLGEEFIQTGSHFQQLLNALDIAQSENNVQALLQVERLLWPTKITDIDIPAYIVPIWPEWAMHMFDLNIAKQTLFGADPSLMFNMENVYYRASQPKLEAPARILWYISQRRGDFQGTMSIRACSYLDEVIVGKPKELFSRFKRLGIYSWEDVYRVAKWDTSRDIMAFRFSNTELFDNPIHRDELQEIWTKEKARNFNIQGPIRISNDVFLRLYKSGTQI